MLTGSENEDKNDFLYRLLKELDYYEFHYRMKHQQPLATAKNPYTQLGNDNDDNEETTIPPQTGSIPDHLHEISYAYFCLFLMCPTNTQSRGRELLACNVDGNRQTKRRVWMDFIMEIMFRGDTQYVDLSMADYLMCYKYNARDLLRDRDIRTTSVGQFHMVANGTTFSNRSRSLGNARLDIGGEATKKFSSCFGFAHTISPFMRIECQKVTNSNNEVECEPKFFENVSMTSHTLNEVSIQTDVLIDGLEALRGFYKDLLMQTDFDDEKTRNYLPTAYLLLQTLDDGTPMYSLKDFFWHWSPTYKCKDKFWATFDEQPKLSEKLSRFLSIFVVSIGMVVCIHTSKSLLST